MLRTKTGKSSLFRGSSVDNKLKCGVFSKDIISEMVLILPELKIAFLIPRHKDYNSEEMS